MPKEKKPGGRPLDFLRFRKKRDDRAIAELKKTGGKYKTRSRSAENPKFPEQRLKKGSTVMVTKTPAKMSHRPMKAHLTPTEKKTVTQEFDQGTYQRPGQGVPVGGTKSSRYLSKENSKTLTKAVKEDPRKVKTREEQQSDIKAKIGAGVRVKKGAQSYLNPKGEREYSGTVRDVVTRTPGLQVTTDKPKPKFEKAKTDIAVRQPPGKLRRRAHTAGGTTQGDHPATKYGTGSSRQRKGRDKPKVMFHKIKKGRVKPSR